MTQTQDIQATRPNGEVPAAPPIQALARIVEDDSQFANLLDSGKFSHLQRVATLFANSQLVPAHYQNNVANCFIGMQMAIRLGVDPFMFLQNTYIVYGRPGMEAKLAIALINTSGLFVDPLDYEVVGDDPRAAGYKVRAVATRKATGKPVVGDWIDWELVRAEGWLEKKRSKWQTMPALMFKYRAATFFGRLHCPERLMGMQTVDELRDTGDLPPDRNVASGEASTVKSSKTERLLAKVTSRPVSEGQTFVPADDAPPVDHPIQQGPTTPAQAESPAAEPPKAAPEAPAPSQDVPKPSPEESKPEQTIEKDAVDPLAGIVDPTHILSDAKLLECMGAIAQAAGIPEKVMMEWLGTAVAGDRKNITGKRRLEVYRSWKKEVAGMLAS